jgi:hypothetical protein
MRQRNFTKLLIVDFVYTTYLNYDVIIK